jgi:insulysin
MYRLCFALALSLHSLGFSYTVVQDTNSVLIKTPSFESRKTAKIRLKNGLEAYIVSDPLIKDSGAALAVSVGSWNDPVEYPGMAHFLEHMLFMGTKAYPDEAEYSRFIQANGGAMNAYTASDKTVYSFSISPQSFEGALDRFSHFFIDPLFSQNSISRELHNVDQEHAKNVEHDGSRLYMVFKQTSNSSHPMHAFSTGNAETLSGIPSSVMQEFYKTYYSADLMHLVVMDKAPLDQLIAMVNQKFSHVPVSKKNVALPENSMFSTAQKGALLQIKSLKETRSLSLLWELDQGFIDDITGKTASFIAYLASSEAPGQLADTLKNKGYISRLSASLDPFSKKQGIFSLDIELSEKGLLQKDEVINICFNYLNDLKSIQNLDALYQQWKNISEINFSYQDRSEVFSYVTDLAGRMVDEPLDSFPTLGVIPQKLNMGLYQNILGSFQPQNTLFIVLSKNVSVNEKEPWTGAEYSIKSFSKDKLDSFSRSISDLKFSPIELNPYVPKNFYITDIKDQKDHYQAVALNKFSNIYFKPTNLYGLPEVSIKLKMTPNIAFDKAELSAFFSILHQAVNKELMYDLDASAYCGLSGNLYTKEGSVFLSVNGFNDKSLDLLEKLVSTLSNLKVKEEDFHLFKTLTKDVLSNTHKELGFRQGMIRFNALFDSYSNMPDDVAAALFTMDLTRFNAIYEKIKNDFEIKGLICGNAMPGTTDKIKQLLEPILSKKSLDKALSPKVLELDENKGPFIYKKNLSVQGSSALLAIQQDLVSLESRAKTALLIPALSEQFFDTLRTKQHTGYIAKAYDTEIAKQQFFVFGVQSNSHGSLELLYRFELFIEDFINNFDYRFTEEDFNQIKASLIAELTARKENLFEMASHDMAILTSRDALFNWDTELVETIRMTSYEDVKTFAYRSLSRQNRKRVGFLMEGKLPENRKLSYTPSTLEGIKLTGHETPAFTLLPETDDGYSKKLLKN